MTGPRAQAAFLTVALSIGACSDAGEARRPPAVTSDAPGAPPPSAVPVPPASASAGPTAIRDSGVTLETTVAADEVALRIAGPVRRGEIAVVSARTAANAECSLTVASPSGSSVPGLVVKSADGAGYVSWSWKVETTATPGGWPVEVSCTTASGIRAAARELLRVQ